MLHIRWQYKQQDDILVRSRSTVPPDSPVLVKRLEMTTFAAERMATEQFSCLLPRCHDPYENTRIGGVLVSFSKRQGQILCRIKSYHLRHSYRKDHWPRLRTKTTWKVRLTKTSAKISFSRRYAGAVIKLRYIICRTAMKKLTLPSNLLSITIISHRWLCPIAKPNCSPRNV